MAPPFINDGGGDFYSGGIRRKSGPMHAYPNWDLLNAEDAGLRADNGSEGDPGVEFERMACGDVLRGGTYGIVNAKYERTISIANATVGTHVCSMPSNRDMMNLKWEVRVVRDGGYTVTHVGHGLRADTAPAIQESAQNSPVLGKVVKPSENCTWRIQQSNIPGHYTIAAWPVRDESAMSLCWFLEGGETDTKVTLKSPPSDGSNVEAYHWHFVPLGKDTFPIFRHRHDFVCGGGASYIRGLLPNTFSLTSDFTVLAWAMRRETSDWGTLISFESPQSGTFLFSILLPPSSNPGRVRVEYCSGYDFGAVHVMDGQRELPPPGNWFHVSVVCKSGPTGSMTAMIYVNSELDSTHATNSTVFSPSNMRIVLGRRKVSNLASCQWSGVISHLELYQAVMDQKSIHTRKANFTFPDPVDAGSVTRLASSQNTGDGIAQQPLFADVLGGVTELGNVITTVGQLQKRLLSGVYNMQYSGYCPVPLETPVTFHSVSTKMAMDRGASELHMWRIHGGPQQIFLVLPGRKGYLIRHASTEFYVTTAHQGVKGHVYLTTGDLGSEFTFHNNDDGTCNIFLADPYERYHMNPYARGTDNGTQIVISPNGIDVNSPWYVRCK